MRRYIRSNARFVGSGYASRIGSSQVRLTKPYNMTTRYLLPSLMTSSVLLLACGYTQAQVQWMRQGGIGGRGTAIAHDTNGNAYVAGVVNDPALFDAQTTPSHFADAFLAKYDPSGTIQWVRTGGDDLLDHANDVAVDADGNAYITGYISTNAPNPTVAFDGTVITGLGSTDLFLAKYDADGDLLWIRHGGGPLADEGRGVALTPDGDVVVSGNFQGTAAFGTATLVSAGLSDALLLKYDADGNLLWGLRAGGAGEEQAGKLTALPNGDIAVVGQFQQAVVFGTTTLTSAGLHNIFLARFNGDGTPLWAARAGSTTSFIGDKAFDIASDSSGDLVFCGEIAGAADFGGVSVPSNGSLDVFLARYTGSGAPVWVRHGGGPLQDHAYGIALDAEGNCYLTGQVADGSATMFEGITLAPFGNESVFLAKYNAAGTLQWVRRYAPGLGGAVDALDDGCLYFTGGASGIIGQPAFDDQPWQYKDRAIFTALFCEPATSVLDHALEAARTPSVFPNPVAQRAQFTGLAPNAPVQVFDALGQAVTPVLRGTSLDVSAWNEGLYFARTPKGTVRFAVQR
ncbi:MAG: SBBP repeat-containing protein [Flavobacteriales bacterium]|nr:SBBP repeat-containing protein [Flavobacteriales bacterium]